MQEEQTELFDTHQLDPAILAHLDDIAPDEQERWPELLKEFHDVLKAQLIRQGADATLAPGLLLALCEHLGGCQVYIPRGDALKRSVRDMQIWNEFNGHNVDELARRHQMSFVSIYKALARMRALERKRRQPELF